MHWSNRKSEYIRDIWKYSKFESDQIKYWNSKFEYVQIGYSQYLKSSDRICNVSNFLDNLVGSKYLLGLISTLTLLPRFCKPDFWLNAHINIVLHSNQIKNLSMYRIRVLNLFLCKSDWIQEGFFYLVQTPIKSHCNKMLRNSFVKIGTKQKLPSEIKPPFTIVKKTDCLYCWSVLEFWKIKLEQSNSIN